MIFTPKTNLEKFLAEHGSAAPLHPDFHSHLINGELLILGEKERLPNGKLGIRIDVSSQGYKPTALVYTSVAALMVALFARKQAGAPYAILPGKDLFEMTSEKIAVMINSGMDSPFYIENPVCLAGPGFSNSSSRDIFSRI